MCGPQDAYGDDSSFLRKVLQEQLGCLARELRHFDSARFPLHSFHRYSNPKLNQVEKLETWILQYLTTKIEETIISIYSRLHHFSHLEVVFATDHPGACQEETHMLMTQLRGEIAAELRQMHRQELNNFSLQKLGRDWLEHPIG